MIFSAFSSKEIWTKSANVRMDLSCRFHIALDRVSRNYCDVLVTWHIRPLESKRKKKSQASLTLFFLCFFSALDLECACMYTCSWPFLKHSSVVVCCSSTYVCVVVLVVFFFPCKGDRTSTEGDWILPAQLQVFMSPLHYFSCGRKKTEPFSFIRPIGILLASSSYEKSEINQSEEKAF